MKKTNVVLYGILLAVDVIWLMELIGMTDSFRYYLNGSFRSLVILGMILLILSCVFNIYMLYKALKGESTSKNVKICPSCGTHVTATSNVCWRCHYPLTHAKDTPPQKITVTPAPEAPQKATDKAAAPVAGEEQIKVYLTGLTDQLAKINVIRVIREQTGLSLSDAKKFVENPPSVVKIAASPEEAAEIKALLESAGATVELS